ncbi:replicative DNA helicase [Candidatus Uhrbacteria bacterium CG_4_9_14_3_um_filter_41_35]|uniref:Replicative DNA helicase n=1 Tax=Candidatus Uhrbacteria bacterium CG_4_9_14_3_um_filter_41_35 TaxID=1975034 RepID=A0A2M7XDP1_9BACT|nr:MAG: replicative DNA helicase [Candidatus Uhrbacteria bacterium CG11_big_fil_rev_8_21_14_0_20_41_9]PJA45997.1 MAG: replicative DNA helicase [Candidatus Uhrbacteria bacterium CG_4_9_14_3_um_filter_41_35]
MNTSINKIPPHNLEAEESILGAILIDQEALLKIVDVVKTRDFYKESYGIIYETITELFERHEPIDILSLGNRLEEKDKLKQIGGRTTLVELTNKVATAAHISHYASIISKKSTLRRLLRTATEITELAFQESEDIDSLLDQAEQKLFNVSTDSLKTAFVPIRSILANAFDRIDMLHKKHGQLSGAPTGFKGLDNLLGGLQDSDLIILAARPSVGKTAFALDIVRNVGKAKLPVGFFSLEMANEQLVDRMICAEANVDLWKLRTGRLSDKDDDFPRIGSALATLSEAPIYVDDSATANIMTIRTKCRRLKSEHGLSLIVIDYLQLMEGRATKSDNRTQEIAEISRGLKQIAKELSIPVLALAQLSRAVEQTKPAIPKLSHLRESGSIEQDADIVMFLYRKAADRNYLPEELSPEEQTLGEVHIAKHRNGPTGMVKLFWDAKRASYRNMETSHVSAPAPQVANNINNVGLPPGVPPKQ